MTAKEIRVILFDLGGVVLESPIKGLMEYGKKMGSIPWNLNK